MRGIILAAGKGSRLNGTAGESPKCLVELGGQTLVVRQIEALRGAGIEDITVVVGCQADRVRRACGNAVTYVENARYAETNSMYSLWMARPLLYEGFVVLNCDVVFHPVLLSDLLTARHENALLLAYREADQAPFGDEEMKVKVRCGRVVDMSKRMGAADADGENLGVVKFGPEGAAVLVDIMDHLVAAGGLRDWAPRAFAEFARHAPAPRQSGREATPGSRSTSPRTTGVPLRDVLPEIEADAQDFGRPYDGFRRRPPPGYAPVTANRG
jgi:L-glutamine-phosphate cytidylyltransferase